MRQVALTITEAATTGLLDPPVTEHQLRVIVRALRIPPAGTRRDGHIGHPQNTYDAAELMRLHAALSPWLRNGSQEPRK